MLKEKKKKKKDGHSCLVSDLRGKTFSFLVLNVIAAMNLKALTPWEESYDQTR